MSPTSKTISGWFGYSRRERRASAILLFIILIVASARFFSGPGSEGTKIINPVEIEREPPLKRYAVYAPTGSALFKFDPNRASFNELQDLGLSRREAQTLLKYRSRGGKFRSPDDLNKIYGIDSLLAARLIPFILINETAHGKRSTVDSSAKRIFHRKVKKVTDINRCDSADLEALPCIGPVLSARIIRYRELLGGYYSVVQLREIYGITDSVYNVISPLLTADSTDIRVIDINKAEFTDLIRHPYFERYDVRSVLKYRSLNGEIDSLPELVKNKILSRSNAGRLRPYLRFRNR